MEVILGHLLKRAKDLYLAGKLPQDFAAELLRPFLKKFHTRKLLAP